VFRYVSNLARLTALMIVALVATACVAAAGAAPSGPASPDPSTPGKSDRIVFRVSWEGGFVPPEILLGRLPIIVVYEDGRVITQGPQLAIYPGPLMPNLVERTLSPEALDRLIELARDKDLLKTIHYDFPGIADAADTVLEINVDGESYRVSAYALAEAGVDVNAGPNSQLTPEEIAGRAALSEFIDALTSIPASDFVDEEHAYEITRLQVFAGVAVVVPDSELPGEQPAVEWPLDDLATAGEAVENAPTDMRCQVLEGDDLESVLPILQDANSLQTFRSGDELYSLVVRPLLPGESGC